MLSLVIPSRNNLKYAKFAYESIRKHLGQDIEVILLDDASTDRTWEWMTAVKIADKNTQIYRNEGPERVGHTVLYDVGAAMATNKVFGIFHADMVASPNYVKNMMKHVKRNVVVSGTRIEPPLHPPGPEKEVMDFGMEPEEFREDRFLNWVNELEKMHPDRITHGVFAPWIMYVEDFQAIGGHDKRVFAPMELEDSDLFNRMMLKGYTFVQSRDAFVYHMTCRGSRFKDGIKIVQEIPLGNGRVWKRSQDSDEYTKLRQNKFREWWRKWHMDVLHDEHMRPVVYPRYDTGFKVRDCPYGLIQYLEPWCDTLYIESQQDRLRYIAEEQPHSKFDISKRVLPIDYQPENNVMVSFNAQDFDGNNHMNIIKQFPLMISDSGENGIMMQYDIFMFFIRDMTNIGDKLINADDPWYVGQLK